MQLRVRAGQNPACWLRLVHQEKEVILKTESLGNIGIYTKDAYKLAFQREPQDDGLSAETFTAPNGQTYQVFKAGGVEQ